MSELKEIIEVEKSNFFMPYSPVVKVHPGGATYFISGATALPLYHQHPHETGKLNPPATAAEQTILVMENLKKCLDSAGLSFADVVRMDCYLTDMNEQDEIGSVMGKYFAGNYPAGTMVEVRMLVDPRLKLEVNFVAIKADGKTIKLSNPEGLYDPTKNGYSHVATVTGQKKIIFVAGQGGEDQAGNLAEDFREQVKQAFNNLQIALQSEDASFDNVAKITVLIVDHNDEKLSILSQMVRSIWTERAPTCTLIPVPRLALPGMLFEVEATAAI